MLPWIVCSIAAMLSLTEIAYATIAVDRFADFHRKCGLLTDSKPRIFAAPDGQHWKEYASLKEIPEPDMDWSAGAYLLHQNGAQTAVQIDGSGQDFSDSSLYCFDAKGKLTRIEREFRTAWGWGYSETDSFKNATLALHQEHYFDTKTEAVISRPAGFDDVHDAMKLKIYRTVKQLPFSKLM